MCMAKVKTGEKLAIGDWIYLWVAKDGDYPAAAKGKEVMITSHGIQTKNVDIFDIPGGYEVAFYAPDGAILQDPGFIGVATNAIQPFASFKDKSRNYELSKFQGKHGGKSETYGTIQSFLANNEENVINHKKVLDDFEKLEKDGKLTDPMMKSMFEQAKKVKIPSLSMDIITIRNRKLKGSSPTLKDVLKVLSDSNFKYKTIHCSFCLAVQNEKGELVWDAKNQTFVKKK